MVVSGLAVRKSAKAAASAGRDRSTSAESSPRMVISPGGIRSPRSGPCGPVNFCATDQARATQIRGLAPQRDYVRQMMRELPYSRWLRYDSLRLPEAGLVKASPQKILSGGTDWRVLNELKTEMKG